MSPERVVSLIALRGRGLRQYRSRARNRASLGAMDFEVVSDELYAAKREDFTALRDERAKQARPDRALVDRIAGLRKPTVAAWLVNQVSRNCPEEIDQLAEVGAALRQAHQRLAGQDLRALSRRRHELIDMLSKRAHWLARKAGYAYGDATGRQVADTFEAAVSDEKALEGVRSARLSAALAPGSPEQWLAAALLPAKSAPRKERKSSPREPDRTAPPREPDRSARAREERQKALREERQKARDEERRLAARKRATRELEAAAQAHDEAEQGLADAELRAEEATANVAGLRERLAEATETERQLRAEVTAARKALTAAKRATKAAEKRAHEAE
ncbi:hypothetical protein [Amycolatopsis alkalitolerans]|uniref:Uncharacterized protein n=1 Tax=Amycolatopsis alkalitolerans TaxID=2547244 RepID=A0A5C4LVR8_9PSEU|nr:hypothetical protein [Amycolatopsis alkalitolerans]TNC20324.1 hypothetical protein FG385_31210 [Amycolatopsis alkalitolerans]